MKIYAKIGPIVYSRKENQSAHTTTADGTLSQGGFCATRGGCFLKTKCAPSFVFEMGLIEPANHAAVSMMLPMLNSTWLLHVIGWLN